MTAARRYLLPVVFAILLAAASPGRAQSDTAARETADTAAASADQLVMTKSPTTAILCSIIPGGGQLYNEDYLKAGLFAAAGGFFVVRTLYFHGLFLDRAEQTNAAVPGSAEALQLKAQREFYRDERDQNAAYYLGVTILSMIDAYVGAHLFDFTVDDEGTTSSKIYLNPAQPGVGVMVRW